MNDNKLIEDNCILTLHYIHRIKELICHIIRALNTVFVKKYNSANIKIVTLTFVIMEVLYNRMPAHASLLLIQIYGSGLFPVYGQSILYGYAEN